MKHLIETTTVLLILLAASQVPAVAQPTEAQWLSNLHKTEAQFGATNPSTAEMEFVVGKFYCSEKKYDRAQPLFDKAMKVFNEKPGTNRDMLRYYSDELARVYAQQGRNKEAESLFKTAISLARQLPGKEKTYALPNTLAGIASLYQSEGRYAEAESALKERLELRHRFMNAGQVDPANVDLANLYTAWGKLDEAKKIFDTLFTISPMPPAVKDGYTAFIAKSSAETKQNKCDTPTKVQ